MELAKAKQALWRQGVLQWKLHENQRTIYGKLRATSERQAVVLCARRFGKSYLGVLMALEDCLRTPGVTIRVIGPEIKQTSDIVHPLISKISADAPRGLVERIKSENRYKVGHSWLVVGGFDSDNIERHRGSECHALYIEESASASAGNYEYGMTDVLLPQLLHSRGKITHLTTPPRDVSHPFVTKTIPEAQAAGTFFRFTIHDNPRLDPDQIAQAVKDCGGEETVAFRREYLCEILKDENFVLVPSFEREAHVVAFENPPYAKWQVVGDWGGSRDKTVLLLTAWDYARAKLLIVDETVSDARTPTSVTVEAAKAMEARHGVTPSRLIDCSGQTGVDLNALGYEVRPLTWKEDPEASLAALNLGFHQARIEVHPRCEHTALCLESARWNKTRTDYERHPVFGHADAVAASRYSWFLKDTANPYPSNVIDRSRQWVRPQPGVEADVASALNPFAARQRRR